MASCCLPTSVAVLLSLPGWLFCLPGIWKVESRRAQPLPLLFCPFPYPLEISSCFMAGNIIHTLLHVSKPMTSLTYLPSSKLVSAPAHLTFRLRYMYDKHLKFKMSPTGVPGSLEVKDMVLLLLWHGFDPRPGYFHMLRVQTKIIK